MKKLHKHIFCHTTGDGLNIGCVVGDEGPVSIDLPMSAEEALAWRAQVGQLTDKPLRAVIFTSPGRVSSDALAAISPQPGALSIPAVIQDAGFAQLYAALEASQPRALEPLTPAQLRERAVLPDVTFSDAMTIVVATSAGPLFVDVAAVGRHAPGSAYIVVRDTGVAFAGEAVTNHEPPIITHADLDAWSEWLAGLRRNRKLTTIVPGRGPAGDTDMLAETQAYLKAARAGVQKLVKAQRPRTDVVVLIPDLAALYAAAPGKARRSSSHSAADSEALARRIRNGLERLYDEMVNQAQPAPAIE